jgi:hypothetical protein
MRFLNMILMVAVAGIVAGCTSTSGSVKLPAGPEAVASEKSLILPPPGGPSIVSVVETKRGNGVEQTLSLFTSSSVPGQNFLKIQLLGASGSNPDVGGSRYKMIGETAMSREAFRSVPGVAMVRNTTFLQNSYGPFAYASGRSRGGDTCIYGWQQIRSSMDAQTQARNFGMIQVRLRLCDANASERQLLSVMYGYTVTGTLNGEIWNPYGDVRGTDPTLGRTGAPIYPDDGGYRAAAMPIGYDPAPVAVRRTVVRRAAVAQPAQVRQQTAVQPPPLGPRVPLPDQQTMEVPKADAATPQLPEAAAPVRQSAKAGGVTVPSPDCIGDAATAAACQR